MKKRLALFPFLFTTLLWTGCGKQTFDIGREDPEQEIKKCLYLSQHRKYEEATECLEIFKSRFPRTQQGQEAELRIADNYFQQGQFLLAADTYRNFAKLHPNHPRTDYALYRAGVSYFREAPKVIDRDQKYLLQASEQLELALYAAPDGTYRNAIMEALDAVHARLAKRIYHIANFYYRTGEYISAIGRFQELVGKYPQSPFTAKSLYLLAKANLAEKRRENARQAVETLLQNFPKDRWTAKAEKYFLNRVRRNY